MLKRIKNSVESNIPSRDNPTLSCMVNVKSKFIESQAPIPPTAAHRAVTDFFGNQQNGQGEAAKSAFFSSFNMSFGGSGD